MRKEFVYSMIALGAIPVSVNASVNAYVSSTVQTVSTQAGVNLETGKLVPGKYKLTSSSIIGNEGLHLSLKVGDGATQVLEMGDKINVALELTNPKDKLIIWIASSTDGLPVSIPGLKLEVVDFDFAALADKLQTKYNNLENILNGAEYGTDADKAKYGTYQTYITSIKNADGVDGYKVYSDENIRLYEFYNDQANFWMFGAIDDAVVDVKAKEKDYQEEALGGDGTPFAKAKTAYANLSEYLKKYEKLDELLTAAQDAFNKLDGTPEKTAAAKSAIKAFVEKVDKAVAVDAANTKAYEAIKAKYDVLHNYIDDDVYANLKDKLSAKGYAALWTEADGAYAPIGNALLKLGNDIEDAKTAGNVESKTKGFEESIQKIKQDATTWNTEYTLAMETLDAANETLKGKQDAADKKITKAIRDANDDLVSTEITNVDNAIAALATLINNNKGKKADINDNLKDLSAYTKAIDDAMTALNAKLEVYNAYLGLLDNVDKEVAKADFAKVQKAADDKKCGDTYGVATLWKTSKDAIDAYAKDAKDMIEANKAKAKTYGSDDKYKKAFGKITDEVNKFNTYAPKAIEIYAQIKKDAADANKLITEVIALTQTMDIWEQKVNDNARTPYGSVLNDIATEVGKQEGFLDESLNRKSSNDITKDTNHYGYLNKNTSANALSDELATLKAMKEQYKEDQKAYEAQRDAQIAQNIQDNIEATANEINGDINDAKGKTNFGPLADALAADIKKVTDKVDAIVAAGGSIDERTKNFETLKAMRLPGGDVYKLINETIPAYKTQVAAYNEIIAEFDKIDFAKIKEQTKKNDPNITYYTDLLDGKYTKAIADLKTEIGKDKDWDANKATLKQKVTDLNAEIAAVPGLATANLNAYNDAKYAYNGKDNKNAAVTVYNKLKEDLKKFPSSQYDKQDAALDAYKDAFDKLIADAETSYKNGKAVDDKYSNKIVLKVVDMENDFNQWTDEVNYNVQVAKDNKVKYEETIPAAKKAAQDAFTKVANDMNGYRNLQSTDMKNAETAAGAELEALNELLTGFNDKLDAIQKKADAAYTSTVSPAVFDATDEFATAFAALATQVNEAKAAFLAKIKEAIATSVPASIKGYEEAIATSKDKTKNFSSDGKEVDLSKVNWYDDVNAMLKAIKDAYGADELIVKTLDQALLDAEGANGIAASIKNMERTQAKAALLGINVETAYLEKGDKDTYNSKIAYINKAANADNVVAEFTDLQAQLLALKSKADTNKKNSETIAAGVKAIGDAQTILDTAFGRIDVYAAGSQVKAELEGYQATLDQYAEVTLDNAEAAKTAGADVTKKLTNKDQHPKNLYTAEYAILTDLVARAENEYITYAGVAAEADVNTVKAQIAAYKAKVAEINKVATGEQKVGDKVKDYAFVILEQNAGDAYYMPDTEKNLTSVIKTMQDKNGTNVNAKTVAELKSEVEAEKARLKNWNAPAMLDDDKTKLTDDYNDIIAEIAAADLYIDNNEDQIQDYKANVEAKIADINADITKLLADVATAHDKAVTTVLNVFTTAENYVKDAAAEVKTLGESLNIYEAYNNYNNKLKQMSESVEAMGETVAANKAKADSDMQFDKLAKLAATTADDALALKNSVHKDVTEINGNAKNDYINARVAEIEALINAVDIKAADYTTSDKATLDGMKDAIVATKNKAKTDAQNAAKAADVKKKLDKGESDVVAAIDKLKAEMKKLSLTVDVRGKINVDDPDDNVNNSDFIALANIIAEGNENNLSDDMMERCDVTGNGVVDIEDLVWVRYFTVFHQWPNAVAGVRAEFASANDAVSMQVVSVQGNITRVAVDLTNDTEFANFQLNMQLPAGAKIVGKSLGERVEGASLISSQATTGSIRFLAVSSADNKFAGNEGAVLYLDIENLNGEIAISSAIFVDTDLNGHNLVGSSETTGIRETIANALDSATQKFYDVSGRMLNSLKNGINIIRNSDGTSKKVLKK